MSATNRREFLAAVGIGMEAIVMGGASAASARSHLQDEEWRRTLGLRKEELRRRVDGLPRELDDWQIRVQQDLDKNAHFSQLRAVRILLDLFIDRQRKLLDQLDPAGDRDAFLDVADQIVKSLLNAQFVWQFFGSKLNLRFVPDLKDSLWIADTIAYDCHRPALERAARQFAIISKDELREPPLCYYTPQFSAATWARGTMPADLRDRARGTYRTPIPVIELPADQPENFWDLVILAHEVGHDLEADLQLHDALVASLRDSLKAADAAPERIETWVKWMGETFADLVAVQLVGPAFVDTLMHLLLLPAADVVQMQAADPHPTHYVRILMNTAYVRTLIPTGAVAPGVDVAGWRAAVEADARRIEAAWTGLYPVDPLELRSYRNDFPAVFRGLMDTKLALLKDRTVRDVVPYTALMDKQVRQAIPYMKTGLNPPSGIPPRLCAAAAQLATAQAVGGDGDVKTTLAAIQENLARLVRANAPMGLRADNGSERHRKFIADFEKRMIPSQPGPDQADGR